MIISSDISLINLIRCIMNNANQINNPIMSNQTKSLKRGQDEYQKIQEHQASQSHKYPSLFRLKTITLIVIVLALIFVIVDVLLLVFLLDNEPPSQNTTFIDGILLNSNLLTNTNEITFLIQNMLEANPDTQFQYAQLVKRGVGFLDADQITKIYQQNLDQMLFLMKIKVGESAAVPIGIYMHGSFPIPEEPMNNRTYFTFELQDQRKSIIFSLSDSENLKYQNDIQNPLECKTYEFLVVEFLSLLKVIKFSIDDSGEAFLQAPVYSCFDGIASSMDFLNKMNAILGVPADFQSQLSVQEYELYHLQK